MQQHGKFVSAAAESDGTVEYVVFSRQATARL